jgi:soluble lytic murein transglycosylase-like protein
MRKHLLIGLIGLVTLGANPAQAEIVAVRENGRVVYVDVPSASASPSDIRSTTVAAPYGPRNVYLYYSKTEHRWKRVPSATGVTMRKARSAAADVQQYIQWRQQQPAFRVNYGESAPVADATSTDAAAKPGEASAEKPASAETSDNSTVATSVPARATVTNEQLDAIIEEAAAKHGVDSNLVRAVIKVESNFNPRAVSRKGAMGLMQLMPQTARSLQVANPFDARQNVDGGVRHLKSLLENFNGDVTKSVAAYNAGAGAVTRNGGVPPFAETQAYVRRINQLYNGQTPVRPAGAAPIRIYRDQYGVLTFSNE